MCWVEEEESAVELIAVLAVGEQGGSICIHMVDSLFCTEETNNIVKQLHSKKNKVHRKISMEVIPMLESPVCMLSHFSWVQLFMTLCTVACQAPLSMGFSRQEYWSGLPFPPPGDCHISGIQPVSPVSPALQVDSLPLPPSGKSLNLLERYNSPLGKCIR